MLYTLMFRKFTNVLVHFGLDLRGLQQSAVCHNDLKPLNLVQTGFKTKEFSFSRLKD